MTVQQALDYLDGVKPNAFSQGVKLNWLSEIEGKIALEIRLETPESLEDWLPYTAENLTKTLKTGVPYTGVYTWWLQAQADLANGEYDRAQNTMAMFNNAWSEYLRWYCQRYDPVQEG
jgi:hypothetical protein